MLLIIPPNKPINNKYHANNLEYQGNQNGAAAFANYRGAHKSAKYVAEHPQRPHACSPAPHAQYVSIKRNINCA